MLSEGIQTGRGRRGAYLHRDRVHGLLRARRGARLAALTSGGAIPEVADYRVVADPDETFVGSVFEDFAIESMPGDIFLLGSTSWRIRRVESGVVRVVDAQPWGGPQRGATLVSVRGRGLLLGGVWCRFGESALVGGWSGGGVLGARRSSR